MAEEKFDVARAIYENGAFSKSIATLRLKAPLSFGVSKGSRVSGVADNGSAVGILVEDYTAGAQIIQVQYQVGQKQNSYSDCQVGANPNPNLSGCFVANGLGR